MDRNRHIHMLTRYAYSTGGIFLVAFAIAMMVRCNLGVNTLSGPPYVLTRRFPGSLTLGQYTVLVNTLFILIQLAVLRSRFKFRYLLQIAASLVLGSFIDLSNIMLSWLEPVSLAERIVLLEDVENPTNVGAFFRMEVVADSWMLSAEMTADAIAMVTSFRFRDVKVAMDSAILLVTVTLCLSFFGNPFCAGEYSGFWDCMTARAPGVVVGMGTIVSSVLIGLLMRFTDPLAERWLRKLLK